MFGSLSIKLRLNFFPSKNHAAHSETNKDFAGFLEVYLDLKILEGFISDVFVYLDVSRTITLTNQVQVGEDA